jgi:hypothetical protein
MNETALEEDIMKRRNDVTVAALALLIGGCNPIVLDPVETGEITDQQGDVALEPNAIAYHEGQYVEPGGVEPMGSVVLFFGSQAQECASPHLTHSEVFECESLTEGWQVTIVIPPDLVQPGAAFPLDDAHMDFIEVHEWWCGGEMGGVFGPGYPGPLGTLEITGLDEGTIAVTLELDETTMPSEDILSGAYVASFCP